MNDHPIAEHKLELMTGQGGNPELILEKRRDYPGTAALVDRLMPYYQHAEKSMRGNPEGAPLKFVPGIHPGSDTSHFPSALGDSVVGHLTALQSSAFFFEAQGNTDRADEIRDVAEALSGMLNLIQSIGQNELPGNGKSPRPVLRT